MTETIELTPGQVVRVIEAKIRTFQAVVEVANYDMSFLSNFITDPTDRAFILDYMTRFIPRQEGEDTRGWFDRVNKAREDFRNNEEKRHLESNQRARPTAIWYRQYNATRFKAGFRSSSLRGYKRSIK